MTYIAGIIPTTGWVCCDCGEPVELVRPGAWWCHIGLRGNCHRLMDDAYHPATDRYYQREEDD